MADKNEEVYTAKWWLEQISAREKTLDQDWRTGADRIVAKYLDKRKDNADGKFNYNVFWANTGILKAALYAKPPRPLVSRTWEDPNDEAGRVGGRILQRILEHDLQKDHSDIDESLRLAIEDHLVPGLGQVWHRYEAILEEVTIPAVIDPLTGVELAAAVTAEKIKEENVVSEYLHWRDFIWGACRVWDECPWVARRAYMTKGAFQKKFGKPTYDLLKNKFESSSKDDDEQLKAFKKDRITVFEVWCKETKKVHFVTPGFEKMLQEKDDPLKLDKFYPCPKPLLSTHTTDSMVPRPDYVMVQDQYEELNELNSRIYLLEKALRVLGVYDKTNPELKRMLGEGRENTMIPVENWGNLSEKGGLKGVVDWFPLETIAKVLTELRLQKQDRLQEIYELTGISDIMRGVSEARETAAAQKLKAQYSSVRLQYRQSETARFAEDSLRIRSQIICDHFQKETILSKSQIGLTEDGALADQAIQLLKERSVRQYRIRVAEESLALPDYNAERETRVEYLTAVGQFISQLLPLAEAKPEVGPYIIKVIQWVSSGFRGAQQIEAVMDQAFTAMVQASQQPKEPPPPDPKILVAQLKEQGDAQRAQMDQQAEAARLAQEERIAAADRASEERMTALTEANKRAIEEMKLGFQGEIEASKQQNALLQQRLDAMMQILLTNMTGKQAQELEALRGSVQAGLDAQNNDAEALQAAADRAATRQSEQAERAAEEKAEKAENNAVTKQLKGVLEKIQTQLEDATADRETVLVMENGQKKAISRVVKRKK